MLKISPYILFLIFIAGASFGGLTEGTYEIQTLGGKRTGEMVVSVGSDILNGKKVQTVRIKTVLDGDDDTLGEDENVVIDDKGLFSFKKIMQEPGKKTVIEGERDAHFIQIRGTINDQKFVQSIPLKEFDFSQYEMDLPQSPFFKMTLNQRRAMRVFLIDGMATGKSVRVVVEKKKAYFNNKEIDVFVTNTSLGEKVYQSWFETKTHKLIYERQPERIIRRMK